MINVEYTVENDKPIVHIFSRDENGKRIYDKVRDFEPYFYVNEDEQLPNSDRIVRVENGFITVFGDKVKKIIVKIPKDVEKLRKDFNKHYEADISFVERVIIDKYKTIPKTPIRTCNLDIEIEVINNKFPNITEAESPIISISCYDNFLKRLLTFVWTKDKMTGEEEIKTKEYSIYTFRNEVDMLNKFIHFIKTIDPDIIIGWHVVGFDLSYLINRLKKLNLPYKDLSPLKIVYVEKDRVVIKGRICFDILEAYKKLRFNRIESNHLGDVGVRELGIGKIYVKDITQLWREDWQQFVKYNQRDVLLVRDIEQKYGMINYFDEIRRLAKTRFENVMKNSKIVDSLVLSYGKQQNVVLPSRDYTSLEGRIKGATVLEPTRGLHKNIISLDLTSLYPSIIMSCNLSPDTVDDNGEISIRNMKFTNKKTGIIPQILFDMFALRQKIKKEMKTKPVNTDEYKVLYTKQYAVKVILNSVYGVMSYESFRFYNPKIADTVTFMGREILEWTKNRLEGLGYEVITGDTDSSYIKSKKETVEEIIEEGKQLQSFLNDSYFQFAEKYGIKNHYWNIEFDKIARTMLITGKKKRYAINVIYSGGQISDFIEVVGFEERRSDNPRVIRDIQRKVFELVLREVPQEKLIEFLNIEMGKIKTGYYSFEDISVPAYLERDWSDYKTELPKVRGCRFSERFLGLTFTQGDKPKLLYVVHSMTDCVCFYHNDEVKTFTPNYQYIIEHIFKKKIERILEVLGLDFNFISGQTSLLEVV